MTFTFYSTPGHGYLRVPKKKFIELGGDPKEISQYSGHDSKTLYLEEDCDACYFIDLVRENGHEFEHKVIYKDSVPVTHNYNPDLFNFEFREGVKVELCSEEIGTLGFLNGTTHVVRTTTGMVYKIPKTNPFRYIVDVLN